jgi:hypothetical protein
MYIMTNRKSFYFVGKVKDLQECLSLLKNKFITVEDVIKHYNP